MANHKALKSISHNFGHSFISLMNYITDDYFLGHLLKQVRQCDSYKLTIDILKNKAEPIELITDKMNTSINYWVKWFPTLVEKGGSSMDYIASATLSIEFDLDNQRPNSNDPNILESHFICLMTIIDDRGKSYEKKQEGWWFTEN